MLCTAYLKAFFSFCWEVCTIYPNQLQAFFPGVYLLAALEASGSTMQTGSILQKPHVTVEASGSPTQLWKPSEAMNNKLHSLEAFRSLQKPCKNLPRAFKGFQSCMWRGSRKGGMVQPGAAWIGYVGISAEVEKCLKISNVQQIHRGSRDNCTLPQVSQALDNAARHYFWVAEVALGFTQKPGILAVDSDGWKLWAYTSAKCCYAGWPRSRGNREMRKLQHPPSVAVSADNHPNFNHMTVIKCCKVHNFWHRS